jgi:protoheme IX farnesyltransferase
VGFPGAIPFMLGCCNRRFWDRSWNIILIQFFGNPHFWAIGWFLYEDYEKAGLCCQQAKKDKGTALQVILYTGWLIIASLLPLLGYW